MGHLSARQLRRGEGGLAADVSAEAYNRLWDAVAQVRRQLDGLAAHLDDVAEKAGRVAGLAAALYPEGEDYHGRDYLSQMGFWGAVEGLENEGDPFNMEPMLRSLGRRLDDAIAQLGRRGGR